MKELIEAGADVGMKSSSWMTSVFGRHSGQQAYHWAAAGGHVEAMKLLSAYDVESTVIRDDKGHDAVDVAEKELMFDAATLAKDVQMQSMVAVRVVRV